MTVAPRQRTSPRVVGHTNIIRKHHDPAAGIHVVQIEVTMDTYMYGANAEPNLRYALKQQRLDIIQTVLGDAIDETIPAGPRGRTAGR